MLNELFVSPLREKYVEIGEEKFVLPIYFNEHWEKINQVKVREDDVYITGRMKTGTTWVHKIVNLIVYGMNSNDTNTSRLSRHKFLELPISYNIETLAVKFPVLANTINELKDMKSPRCIRSHLPWFLLSEEFRNGTKSPKIIHVLRNLKDTCISFNHHNRSMDGYRGTFEEFCRLFLAGRVVYGPFYVNIKSYWEQRNRSNLFFVKYSDLKKDLPRMIKNIADFLEKSISENEIQDLAEYRSMDSMRKHVGKEMSEFSTMVGATYNTCVGQTDFVRECKEGGYKTVMSEKLIREFDKCTKKALAGTELCFQ
ncbi:hypothetical protein ILUMI_16791 [Ignelater luminosus]|uniref:Sulfotransferase domain-containing protein n=1 Tax=Ignelater luminosus TaxID=2038154 RepID=A0A8K0CQB1_IGNLU|nr:hypothetical protein ILUMI_16791 [Ignelater luminosus]